MLTALAPSSGSISSPEALALAPVTSCRNNGRNTIAANSEIVAMNSATLTTTNTRSPNSRSGSTGSAAYRAEKNQATRNSAPAANRPMITGEDQA